MGFCVVAPLSSHTRFLRVQRVHLLVVQLAQLLCLRNSDAEAVILRHESRRTCTLPRMGWIGLREISVTDVRQVSIAVSTSQQLFESRLQFLEVERLIRQHTLMNFSSLFGTESFGGFLKQRKAWILDAVTVNILNIYHYFSTRFLC